MHDTARTHSTLCHAFEPGDHSFDLSSCPVTYPNLIIPFLSAVIRQECASKALVKGTACAESVSNNNSGLSTLNCFRKEIIGVHVTENTKAETLRELLLHFLVRAFLKTAYIYIYLYI